MKQEITSYLSTIRDEIFNLTKFLYENPEESFHEDKACRYLIDLFKKHNFKIIENYVDIPTAFYAEYGKGHPKICYLCEYDALKDGGHISGHNLISAMSVAAGLALAKVVPKIGGTVIVLGCPGEYIGSAKVTMAKQGVFNDVDVALMCHPEAVTAKSGTSMAVLPLSIKYKSSDGLAYRKKSGYSALDACLFTFNAISALSKGFEDNCSIDGVIVNGGAAPYMVPYETEAKFYIRAPKIVQAEDIENKIKELVKVTSFMMDVSYETSLYELPYEDLVPNDTLSRLFSHNLKECGIIDIEEAKDTTSALSIGTVSHFVPSIHPYINMIEDDSIKYPSSEFAASTIKDFAQDKVMKAAQALAITGIDLIEREDLLSEVKVEFNSRKHKL